MGIMIQGTASDVGKSMISTVFCRLLSDEGLKVAPFKAQNMTDETYVLNHQQEIALSQAIQAQAARVAPSVRMNPIVVKPGDKDRSNLILFGKRVDSFSGNIRADDFYEKGLDVMKQSIEQLRRSFDTLIVEGAGSPVELNLKDKDIVNMKAAAVADVPVLLVADISRGGVFASIVGTLALLNEAERRRVKGIIINKFRGDVHLFQQGVQMIEAETKIPVVGVIPHLDDEMITAIEPPPLNQTPDIQATRTYDTHVDKLAHIVRSHMNWDDVKHIMKRWTKS